MTHFTQRLKTCVPFRSSPTCFLVIQQESAPVRKELKRHNQHSLFLCSFLLYSPELSRLSFQTGLELIGFWQTRRVLVLEMVGNPHPCNCNFGPNLIWPDDCPNTCDEAQETLAGCLGQNQGTTVVFQSKPIDLPQKTRHVFGAPGSFQSLSGSFRLHTSRHSIIDTWTSPVRHEHKGML